MELIKRMISEEPDAYEPIPSGTYAELVKAQIEHDKKKRAEIERAKSEALENLRALQQIVGAKQSEELSRCCADEESEQPQLEAPRLEVPQPQKKKSLPFRNLLSFVERAARDVEKSVTQVVNSAMTSVIKKPQPA